MLCLFWEADVDMDSEVLLEGISYILNILFIMIGKNNYLKRNLKQLLLIN